MNTNQFQLTEDHKKYTLRVERMAIYLQSKIIEAFDQENQAHYIFFFKNRFLTMIKAARLKRNSYIERAFKNGIIVPSPSPLIQAVLNPSSSIKKRSFTQLMNHLKKDHTPQERALIATYFDSFISKKKLFAFIQSLFFEHRRNGQMFSCYRILRILQDFCPNERWVKQLSNDLSFLPYAKVYDQLHESLLQKDPLFIEKVYFLQKDRRESFVSLAQILKNQNRWVEEFALHLSSLENAFSSDHYNDLKNLLEQHFQDEEIVQVLKHSSLLSCQHVQQDLLNRYFKLSDAAGIIFILSQYELPLTALQRKTFMDMLEKADLHLSESEVESLNNVCAYYLLYNPRLVEKLLQRCVVHLLKKHDLLFVKNWLKPLEASGHTLPIFKKINDMVRLKNDPDQQLLLGQLFHQFKQYERAIDCFSWEMELKPADPTPVKWLLKIYSELGMKREFNDYQQVYLNMVKHA